MATSQSQTLPSLRRRMKEHAQRVQHAYDAGKRAIVPDADEKTIAQFKALLKSMEQAYQKCDDVWNELCDLLTLEGAEMIPSKSDKDLRSAVESLYDGANAFNEQLKLRREVELESARRADEASRFAELLSHRVPNIADLTLNRTTSKNLPKIQLPKFNGDLGDWVKFRDIFISLVQLDDGISDTDKFHYLRTSLVGRALSVISHIEISDANYKLAWDAVKEAFDKPRLLASSFLDKVLSYQRPAGGATADSLQIFLSTVGDSVAGFKNLKIEQESEFILFHLMVRGLDPTTRDLFEMTNKEVNYPTYDALLKFVRERCMVLQLANQGCSSSHSQQNPSKSSKYSKPPKPQTPHTSLVTQVKRSHDKLYKLKIDQPCFVCKNESHQLLSCRRYDQASPDQRLQLLQGWQGCKNCLSGAHETQNCNSKWHCRFCSERHHSSLHKHGVSPLHSQISPTPSTSHQQSQRNHCLSSVGCEETQVLLATAVAEFRDSRGTYQPVRMVLDSGSQNSCITRKCVYRLGLQLRRTKKKIAGIGQTAFEGVKGIVSCILRPRNLEIPQYPTDAIVVSNITSHLPTSILPISFLQRCPNIKLADPGFGKPAQIDFLLGADLFPLIWNNVSTPIDNSSARLFSTSFGDVVIGKISKCESENMAPITNLFMTQHFPSPDDINFDLKRFWEIEEINSKKPVVNPDDQICEEHFSSTHYRLPTGRYVVRLPFKNEPPEFSNSIAVAKKRFQTLTRKLDTNPLLKQLYFDFMKEYQTLGHMEKTSEQSKFVIPHHGIVKPGTKEAKIRVVFDGSVKLTLRSLNENLHVGPKLQTDIRDILLNFRRHPFVFSTDIVKMYRMIEVDKRDRPYQHIIWYDSESQTDQPNIFELCTVTYGLSASPYLALRVIRQLVADHGHEYPVAAQVLTEDIYVDDILSGAQSLDETIELRDQIIGLLGKGCFSLSKWASNSPSLIQCTAEYPSEPVFLNDDDTRIKILGLHWDHSSDEFFFTIKSPDKSTTKRGVLSIIARLYDPLGFLTPVIFLMKNFIQEIWKISLDWDEPVPDRLQHLWDVIIEELPLLTSIKIPRFVGTSMGLTCQIVGFSDASEKGYAAVLYLRVMSSNDERATVRLLTSKSKLAPIKKLTIPRLELSGALLLANLVVTTSKFQISLSCHRLPTVCFTDSSIVLGWLQTPTYKLSTFISNRVEKILDILPIDQWQHVGTLDNPSDVASRGMLPSQILQHSQWWEGPRWLADPERSWPKSSLDIPTQLPELKAEKSILVSVNQPATSDNPLCSWIMRFSSYHSLIRASAWLQRWLYNLKHVRCCCCRLRTGFLTKVEMTIGRNSCIKAVQHHHFFQSSAKGEGVKGFDQLRPFVDNEGIVRVGGRLRNANIPNSQKYPILLPPDSHFTALLIDFYHRCYLHPSSNTLQAIIQTQYWIPSLRRLIRSRGFNCIRCYRSRATPVAPVMGDLPSCRVNGDRAFLHVGVDFAGPFQLKESSRRKAAVGKAYLCLYVCMATKAVHLEPVTRLTSEAFIASLDRFVSRRGLPSDIYSDNGTNFLGASNYFKELYQWFRSKGTEETINDYALKNQIDWHFNPPQTPHMGGIWEAGVRSVKGHLFRLGSNIPLTYEELTTLFSKIEAILNSRPLCPLSSSPDDLTYLTPGHFLVGGPIIATPEPSFLNTRENLLSRWQLIGQLSQQFWARWRREYLSTLQRRPKWCKDSENLAVNDLVLLKEDAAPSSWPVARVVQVHPGKDAVVRVVTIQKPSKATLKRAVANLVPLRPLFYKPYPDNP